MYSLVNEPSHPVHLYGLPFLDYILLSCARVVWSCTCWYTAGLLQLIPEVFNWIQVRWWCRPFHYCDAMLCQMVSHNLTCMGPCIIPCNTPWKIYTELSTNDNAFQYVAVAQVHVATHKGDTWLMWNGWYVDCMEWYAAVIESIFLHVLHRQLNKLWSIRLIKLVQ